MRETIERLFDCLNAGDYVALSGLVTEDAVFEVPYADMVAKGRSEFLKVFSETTAQLFDNLTFAVESIYVCDPPPATVVVEYRSRATLRSTGKPYRNQYVGIFVIRDERIDLWREYFNPMELVEAQAT
jgi:ketosteroid isomerase-like protein